MKPLGAILQYFTLKSALKAHAERLREVSAASVEFKSLFGSAAALYTHSPSAINKNYGFMWLL